METDSNYKVGRSNGAAPARRFVPTAKANSEEQLLANWPVLQQKLQNLPDSRPEAVARAKQLIADPDYPPPEALEIMAQQLALRLTARPPSSPS
jgi:hypothetical protein